MKKRIMMTVAGMALAGFSAASMAEMKVMSESALGEVSAQTSAQGYVLTVGSMQFDAPFAYEVYVSNAPAPLVMAGQDLVSTYAPGYPAKVGMARTAGVSRVNASLSLATSRLQAIPLFGASVPSITLSTSP